MKNAKEKLLQICKSLLRRAKQIPSACRNGMNFAAEKGADLKTHSRKAVRFMSKHRAPTTIICAVLTLSMLMSVITVSIREITVWDNGEQTHSYYSALYDEESILQKTEITLHEKDELVITEDGGQVTVKITRAYPVTFRADGKEYTVMTTGGSVEKNLKDAGLTLGEQDLISTPLNEEVSKNLVITIDRVKSETVRETVSLDYKVTEKKTNDLYKGQTKVVQEGKKGTRVDTYSVTYTNGAESSRKKIASEVTEEPVEKILLVGTKIRSSFKKTSSTPTSYKKAIAMEATAYVQGGTTATGRPARVGVVAVDPRVIPLGTKVYVETADGRFIYGTAIAADTGGAIKGNKIDICVASHEEAYRFGRRIVNVYILG